MTGALPIRAELARDNYLRYNAHGGAIIRQSDLSSWARCQLQKFYDDRARVDPDAPQPKALSATLYGTVVHYALLLMEKLHHEGNPEALETALATFLHYWEPENITQIAESRVQEWLPRQTHAGLRRRGEVTLNDYYRILQTDDSMLLGLEYQFAVPLPVGDRVHTLTGTIDRVAVRRWNRKPYLAIEDFKTGKQPTYLRWNTQGTAYAWAMHRPEFWHGWPESGMGELPTFDTDTVDSLAAMFLSWGYRLHSGITEPADLPVASKRFRWINMQEIKFADGGWRNDRDYARLALAADAYVRACEQGTYAVNHIGEVCVHCPHKAHCGGVGLPAESAGHP